MFTTTGVCFLNAINSLGDYDSGWEEGPIQLIPKSLFEINVFYACMWYLTV